MASTRLQMQQRVQQNLNDAIGTYFTPSMVISAIQDGYNEIVLDSECIEGVLTGNNWTSGQIYYDFYDLFTSPNFWKPVRIFNQATNRWLTFVDTRFLDKFRWDWEIASGTPWFACVLNWQYVCFFPHYTNATSSFDLFYKVGPDVLSTDSQLIQIPDPYSLALESWATADLLEAIQEYKKAATYWDEYERQNKALKDHMKSRMQPGFYGQLNDLNFPYPTLP